ncbi:MAG: aldehyde dehydrogenase family protein [Acidimicrobiales bacterium]
MTVLNPYDDSLVGVVACATPDDIEDAVAAATRAFNQQTRRMPLHERREVLRQTAVGIRSRADELVGTIVAEGGKPIRDARREVGRASSLFELASDCLNSSDLGSVLPMDVVPSGVNRFGYTVRVPAGVVAAIVPSNSPINLAANKVAPALAMGNAVVAKPAEQTPLSIAILARILAEAGLPSGAFNVVTGTVKDAAEPLVRDPRVRIVTATGGVRSGEAITRSAGVKKLLLELGSSAANIVFGDADITSAARSLATSSFLSSGQACISAQRIIVHESVVDGFCAELVKAASSMVIGDPSDPETEIGPMISKAHMEQLVEWIEEACSLGAQLLHGGKRVQRTITPTVLADLPKECSLASEEAFGPIVSISAFRTVDEAIEQANSSKYGLQAGVFTRDIGVAFQCAKEIDVGALWVNESSRYRQDNYPFGGMKLSGFGREGVRYAMEELSELKFIGIRLGATGGILG